MNLTIGFAFLAGLASFLTPCVLSLVPAYVGYLGGRSIAACDQPLPTSKWLTFAHGLAFILGFSVIFISLGLTFSALRMILFNATFWLAKIGGVVVVLFGLHMTGIIQIPLLDYDLRPHLKSNAAPNFLSSFLLGIFFSAGWSPCVGPILGSILTLAANGQLSLQYGVILLSAYSLGLALPFMAAALGIGWVVNISRKYKKQLHAVEIVMGIILIIIGVMLFLGVFQQLKSFGSLFQLGL